MTKEQALHMALIYEAAGNGKTIQYHNESDDLWVTVERISDWDWFTTDLEWRIKPETPPDTLD